MINQIICPICCNQENNKTFQTKERLIGTREEFNYGECWSCKGVFLLDKINDFSPYYPPWYHCFDDARYPRWKKYLLQQIYEYNFWGKWIIWSITSKVFSKLYGHKPEQNICWISAAAHSIVWKITPDSIKELSVLDLW